MGGKSTTSTQSVSIPPEVMARYNAVNAKAESVAATPFQRYSNDPNAFVAPLTQAQQQGIAQTGQYAQTAQPYFGAATDQLLQAQQQGQASTQAAYQPLYQGYQAGTQLGQAAQDYYTGAGAAALPFYGAAAQGIGAGLEYAGGLQGAALQQALAAPGAAAPLQGYSAEAITRASQAAQPANVAAMRMGLGAARQAQPYYGAATQGTQAALQAGQPFQNLAAQAALTGSQAVSPEQFSQQGIQQYMSPFMNNVVAQTLAAQAQQNAQQRRALTGEAIKAGAFGGDRSGIAQANLAYQQNLANQQTIANLLQGGYGQALGAFQQQQGVNLAAEQANRAAQQQLAQQALAIGQQGYGQQMGAAQQMAGLGQALFGQGVQGAQTLSGLGQTQYGQQLGGGQAAAQLAQQLYGQGMTGAQFLQGAGQQGFQQQLSAAQQQAALGQALSGLGFQTGQALQGLSGQQAQLGQSTAAQQAALAQQGYGMGAGTAQALAGLGQGAQAAGLQGAQAMLGAGTVQQQTEQAGLQALYNQFLQEKGYPFQVAQFLANIAMGTGALSGSTTTTTQPTSFFSDKRLKEDIEPIGETYDGQKIVKFNYKGSPQKQIGLVAQDVEKHHPDAVGVAAGYKTVDYDKATKDAAKLGSRSEGGGVVPARAGQGYANGGAAFDQELIRQLLANQAGQYAQMYGQSGLPRSAQGVPSRVPAANLPVGRLAVAGSIPQQQPSMMSQGLAAAETGTKIADFAGKIKDKYNEYMSPEQPAPQQPAPQQPVTPASPAAASTTTPKSAAMEGEAPLFGGKIDVADLEMPEEETGNLISNALSLAWTGGRINKATGGEAGDEDTSAPEGIYKPEGAGINIPDESSKQKPLEPAKPPQPGKSGLSEITDAVKTAAKVASMFLLADGGVVPRKEALEGEVLPPREEEKPKGLVRLAAANTASDAPPVGLSAASTTTPSSTTPRTGVAPKAPESNNFDRSLQRTFQFEGGLNKADTNGLPSLYGINKKYHPDFFNNPSKEKAAQIYKTQYWDAIGGDRLDPNMAHVAFDTAVIAGPAKAKQLMAQADGDPQKLLALRKDFQDSLIAKNPQKYGPYQKAWNNRIATLYSDISGEKPAGSGPAVATPGVAGPGRPIRTASTAPFATITESVLPADTSRKTRDILTSENLWVPALAGIGSMLASKSPTLGPAIGEGLVGATAAYTGLQKQQADIAETGARTEKYMADIADTAVKTDPNGLTRVRYITPEGRYSLMPISEFNKLRRAGKAPKIDPRDEQIIFEEAAKEEARVSKAQGTTPQGPIPGQPATTGQPGAQPQITEAAPQYKYIDPEFATEAFKEAQILTDDTPSSTLSEMKDVFTPQQAIAANAATQKQSLLPFGGALAALPADSDPLAGGEAQKVIGPVMGVLQGIGNIFGFQVTDPNKIADYEEVKKEVARLRAQMAQAGNQSAVSALDRLGEGLPSNLNTKEAQARLYSTLLIANQREIDKNNFYNEWFEAARGPDGENARGAGKTGRLATAKFDQKFNQEFYNADKKNLEKMFRAVVEMPDGSTQNLLFMLTQGGKPLPQELKDAIAKNYGERVFRYFNIPYTPSKPKKKAETGSSVG